MGLRCWPNGELVETILEKKSKPGKILCMAKERQPIKINTNKVNPEEKQN